ncbi:hypothetical protein J437_LFUL000188 [Ladona fulva]|uniref:Tubulin-specific chaperone D n=1 Tax=Ladona fulva TaxID=123851 RepID=A0A8K0P2R4_LADFU|nr:hypothetical protein J437_LFUL000188 [Ladona fulva]
MGTLTKRDPQYILIHGIPQILSRTSSINLDWRHGAVLALAEVILALSKCDIIDDKIISSDALHGVEQLVAKAKNSGHFRGLGGELMWCAFLKMIEFASLAHLPLHSSPVVAEWRDSLEECLVHKEASVRERAAITISAFLSEYYSKDTEQCKILVQHFIKGLSGNRTERLGSSLALGSLPAFALKGYTSQVLSAVAACSTCYSPPETVTWADCRKSALKALSSLTLTLKVATSEDEDGNTLSKVQTELVYDCLLKGMEDYTKDGTGDIGAWVREAAMEGLVVPGEIEEVVEELIAGLRDTDTRVRYSAAKGLGRLSARLPKEMADEILAFVLELFSPGEPDGAWHGASFALAELGKDPPLPNVPHGAELLEAIPRDDPLGLTHYTESETFPQIAKKAVNALAEHLQTLPHSSLEAVCATLVKVADEQANSKRLSLPLLRSLEQIIGSGALGPFLSLDDEQGEISLSSHILRIVRQELASSPSVYKRMAGAGVLCQLLQAGVPSAVTKGCLTQLAILLGCSASRVRTATAALLYEALLVAGEESFGSSVEAALSLLAETDWACSDVSVVRVSRNAFCKHLGLSIPRTAPRPT